MGPVGRFASAVLLSPALVAAQSFVDQATVQRSMERVHSGNEALRCEVTPIKPALNFGLRLEAGYTFRIPLNQFSGPDHWLTVLTRITTESAPEPVLLMDTAALPPVPATDFEGEMGGGFFVGEGHYHVNWLLFDDRGRTCQKDWELNAELNHGNRSVKLVMPPNQVAELSLRASTAADRHPDPVAPMRLTVLLDAAPVSGARVRSALSSSDQVFLLGALSALLERIPATSVRLVAFNLAQQKELYRRDGFTLDSMDQLAAALNRLQLAKVDYQAVRSPTGHLNLLANLINQELRAQPASDTVVFLGPREAFHEKLPPGALNRLPGTAPRFFFLPYRESRALAGPTPRSSSVAGGRGAGRGRGAVIGGDLPPLISDADSMAAGPAPGSTHVPARAIHPDSPISVDGLPDTVSLAVAALKGRTIAIETPAQFAKAIEQIERRKGH